MNKIVVSTIGISLLLILAYCSSSVEKETYDAFELATPDLFVAMEVPPTNPISKAGIELGRKLFYDPVLSIDSSKSCASCHQQELAFATNERIDPGAEDTFGNRNSPTLANVGFLYKGLFWDGRADNLEEQALNPITNQHELASNWELILFRIRKDKAYLKDFQEVFSISDGKSIDSTMIVKAIAQFERSLISANSKYDQYLRGELEFTIKEQRGMAIFFDSSDSLPFSECGHCHLDPLFTNLKFENNGIDAEGTLKDLGRGSITQRKYDIGLFKVPTLRNIALTAPYMHDGRFETLEEVIDHYATGGKPGINVSPLVRPLEFTERDKSDLIAFLHTLTDSTFITDPRFSNPFE
ncbi:MAG: cytochrome c peroxidase [Bacteroidota bacterium]